MNMFAGKTFSVLETERVTYKRVLTYSAATVTVKGRLEVLRSLPKSLLQQFSVQDTYLEFGQLKHIWPEFNESYKKSYLSREKPATEDTYIYIDTENIKVFSDWDLPWSNDPKAEPKETDIGKIQLSGSKVDAVELYLFEYLLETGWELKSRNMTGVNIGPTEDPEIEIIVQQLWTLSK